jgi:sphingomyelin phosphodiesterase
MTVHEWIEQRIDEKTFEAQQNDFINNLYKEHDLANPRPKDELIKIALISDLHLSFDYTIGADTDCGKPLCCRSDSGINKNADKNAKKWGDYNCDLPVHTLENLFDFVNSDIKPDAVMWGGDSIPHNLDSLQIDNSV